MGRKFAIGLGAIAVLIAILSLVFGTEISRIRYQMSLFTGAPQADNFTRQDEFYPVNRMSASSRPFVFPDGPAYTLPPTFRHEETTFNSEEFLTFTDTAALLVVHRGQLRAERYFTPGGAQVAWLTHSISKSLVATAIGFALQDGLLDTLDDRVVAHVPTLVSSGYAETTIKQLLEMSSGVRWNEDYADRNSDLNRFGLTMMTGASYDEFVSSVAPERTPGTYNRYTGMDTQALSMVVRRVTGMSLAEYLHRKLWEPLGMQDEAYWSTDRTHAELGLGGLSASARDLAKIGELYRLAGRWQGAQLLDANFVRTATRVNEPRLQRGEHAESAHRMGYGYHWWLPDGDPQDFAAIGIYNQFIYVSPRDELVIVKLSAYRNYANLAVERPYLEPETMTLFRTMATSLNASQPAQ